mmetsp:Transcript_50887/g.83653  ORF Transcript_50887/g.83653 Transcript_50887/m.83653 type:complete len:105 (-) Transcript_50887:107-421(-)
MLCPGHRPAQEKSCTTTNYQPPALRVASSVDMKCTSWKTSPWCHDSYRELGEKSTIWRHEQLIKSTNVAQGMCLPTVPPQCKVFVRVEIPDPDFPGFSSIYETI